uniref:Myb/SANT-like domain-containing protein n=1 Tax=Cucumis melo TaxID=3656 RepID=A0A9I9E8K2_CUCME
MFLFVPFLFSPFVSPFRFQAFFSGDSSSLFIFRLFSGFRALFLIRSPTKGKSIVLKGDMSQKSTKQLCANDVVEIDGLKGEGPWSNKSEALFVDLMDEEVAKGNRLTTTFTKTSWNYMRSQLNASTRFNYSHDQLKNKFNKLRQIYKDFKKILSDMIGNGCDPLLGTINLEEEQWNELFKVNKRAKKFRKSGCPHYEKLVRIFWRYYCNSFFSSFLDVYAENAKRKNDILEKRSFGCTSSVVDESQTSSKKMISTKS